MNDPHNDQVRYHIERTRGLLDNVDLDTNVYKVCDSLYNTMYALFLEMNGIVLSPTQKAMSMDNFVKMMETKAKETKVEGQPPLHPEKKSDVGGQYL